jgi:hypothetical protein
MHSDKEIDDFRNNKIIGLEREKHELNVQKTKIDSRLAEIAATLVRLQTKPPSGACYRCYYESGAISRIRAVPADPAAPGIDRFRCANGHDL